MNEKERLEAKCLRYISAKGIKQFSKLYKALKISKTKFYNLGLHKSEKILNAISGIASEKAETKKTVLNSPKNGPVRSFSEIQAKLFCFKAYKQKNYEKLTDAAKRLIDRQISLLEWVLKIDDKEQA